MMVMTMKYNTPQAAKQVMQELQNRYDALAAELQIFHQLKHEIECLRQKARNDPDAAKRFQRLSHSLERDLVPLKLKLSDCIEQLEKNCVVSYTRSAVQKTVSAKYKKKNLNFI